MVRQSIGPRSRCRNVALVSVPPTPAERWCSSNAATPRAVLVLYNRDWQITSRRMNTSSWADGQGRFRAQATVRLGRPPRRVGGLARGVPRRHEPDAGWTAREGAAARGGRPTRAATLTAFRRSAKMKMLRCCRTSIWWRARAAGTGGGVAVTLPETGGKARRPRPALIRRY